jgi:primosomal replication protein N
MRMGVVEKIHYQQQQQATQTREEKLKLRVFSANNNKKQQHKIRQERKIGVVGSFLAINKKSNIRIEEMGLQEMEVGREP